MALTNPTKLIDVQRLGHFKDKLDDEFYNKEDINAIVGSIADGAQAAELYTFYVDTATMQLKALSTMANLNAFTMSDGYLKINLSATV